MQLGASWFDTVAKELSTGAYSTQAADSFFQQRHDRATAASDGPQWAARAVLADMEPKASVPGTAWQVWQCCANTVTDMSALMHTQAVTHKQELQCHIITGSLPQDSRCNWLQSRKIS
jgi:hypothetical protein